MLAKGVNSHIAENVRKSMVRPKPNKNNSFDV